MASDPGQITGGNGIDAAPAGPNSGAATYWALVRRNRVFICAGGIAGAVIAFAMLVFEKPVYRALTTVELQGFNEGFMGIASVDPQAGTGAYAATPANINTQIRIIESASVRGPVIDRLKRELPPSRAPQNGMLAPFRARLRHFSRDPVQETRYGLELAANSLSAKVVLNTRIISISADSTVPEIAAGFVNAIAAEYIVQNSQQRAVNSERTGQWLKTQIDETRLKLEESAAKLHAFTRQSGITYVGRDEESVAHTKLRELERSLAGVQSERIRVQAQYEQIKSSAPDRLPAIIEDPLFHEYETKLADLKQQHAQLISVLTPAHYKVQTLEQQIAELTAALEKQKQSILDRIRNDYESAVRREQLLSNAYQAQSGTVSSQADKNAQYEMLKREVDVHQQTLNAMLQQANQAAVFSAVPMNNVRVIDTAPVPPIPYRPNGTSYEIYGILGGITAAILLSLLIEAIANWRRSIVFGSPGFSVRLLNVPELGVIPSIGPQSRMQRAVSIARRVPISLRGGNEPDQVMISSEQPSVLAECFRLTLTSILLMSRRGMHPKIIVVTSPGQGEGKTTVAANMAIASAESGRRVLLIDADLRSPRIHVLFGVQNGQGFAEAVARDRESGLVYGATAVFESSVPGLFLMTAGSTEGKALSRIFHAAEISLLLNKLAGQFDLILIDTPPMLQFSDARLVARYSDGVILVLRSGITGRDSALTAREQLAQDHIEVLGTVLNGWDARSGDANSLDPWYRACFQQQQTAGAGQ